MKFKKFYFVGLLLAFSFLSQPLLSQTPTPTPEDRDEIKVSTTLIRLDLVVLDKNNKPVTGLKLDDFEVYENGVRQEVTGFSYISSKPTNRTSNVPDDNLSLQSNTDGTSLKEKIAVPTVTRPLDANSIRRTFVLVVDNLGLNFESVNAVKSALNKFIKDNVRDGDSVTIVTTSGSKVLPPFTSDKKALLAIVKTLKWSPQSRGGSGSYEPIRETLLEELSEDRGADLPGTQEQTALMEDLDRSRNNNSAIGTIGSLNYIVAGMRNLPGRKALVFFSEGFSLSDRTSQESSSASRDDNSTVPSAPAPMGNRFGSDVSGALNRLIQTANQFSVVIYSIDPRGLQFLGMANSDDDIRKAFGRNFKPGQTGDKRTARDDYFRQTQEGLRVLSEETGGFAVINQNGLEDGLDRVADDQSYYLLSYETSLENVNSSKDAIDRVEIKVSKPNLNVRYRNAFYSPAEELEIPQTPRERIGQALAFPFKANEIRLSLYSITGNSQHGDFVRFLINFNPEDLEFKRESKDVRKANFDMLAITLDGDNKPVNQFVENFSISVNEATYRNIVKRGFVYVLPVVLKKSGVYHFRVAVRDSATGKVGAASQILETPKFEKKQLWISNLTLTSVPNEKGETPESNNRVFTDTTLREFASPVTLHFGAQIYNAKLKENSPPDLTMQTRLIHNDRVILENPAEPISIEGQEDLQRIEIFGRIQIAKNLPPGDYILQVIVVDQAAKKKTQIASQWIDFEIEDK